MIFGGLYNNTATAIKSFGKERGNDSVDIKHVKEIFYRQSVVQIFNNKKGALIFSL